MPRRRAKPLRRRKARRRFQRVCEAPGCRLHGEYPRAAARATGSTSIAGSASSMSANTTRNGTISPASTPSEIEQHIRADTTWRRPVWPLGGRRSGNGRRTSTTRSASATMPAWAKGRRRRMDGSEQLTPAERNAMGVLELSWPLTRADREISLQGTGQNPPSRRQWRGAGGRGKAQGNQRRLFHPAGLRAPSGRVISPSQGSPGNWPLAVHKSACDYDL